MRALPLPLVLLAGVLACGREPPTGEKTSDSTSPNAGRATENLAPEPVPAPTSERFVLDDAYAREHGYELPARIEFELPGPNLRRQSPPPEQRVYLRVDQTTSGGRTSEDLMITSLVIPPGEAAERIAFTRGLVESQGLANAMPAGSRVLELREIEVGGMPAVLGIGEFDAKNSGKVYTSMVAVILPEPSTFSIMAHHVAANSEVTELADVGQKGLLAAALSSMSIEP